MYWLIYVRNKFNFFGSCYMFLQLSNHPAKKKKSVESFKRFSPLSFSVDNTMEINAVISTNQKRKADQMESNQPEELRAIKIQKTESVERK